MAIKRKMKKVFAVVLTALTVVQIIPGDAFHSIA